VLNCWFDNDRIYAGCRRIQVYRYAIFEGKITVIEQVQSERLKKLLTKNVSSYLLCPALFVNLLLWKYNGQDLFLKGLWTESLIFINTLKI